MLRRYRHRVVTAAHKLGRERQRSLGTVDKVVVTDISQTAVVNEEIVTPSTENIPTVSLSPSSLYGSYFPKASGESGTRMTSLLKVLMDSV